MRLKVLGVMCLSVAVWWLTTSCGYQVAATSPMSLPGNIQSLYLDRIQNPSTETWLEPTLISEVRDEFIRRGGISWVDRNTAQGLLQLNITRYTDRTKVESADEETLKSEIVLILEAKILDATNRKVLWTSSPIQEQESFVGLAEKQQAQERVVRDIADALADHLTQSF